jgi:hypothetical protein
MHSIWRKLSQDKKYSIELRSCEDVLKDLGSFVIPVGAKEKIDLDEMALVVKSVATCSVNLITAHASAVAERDSLNIAFSLLAARCASSARKISWSRVC